MLFLSFFAAATLTCLDSDWSALIKILASLIANINTCDAISSVEYNRSGAIDWKTLKESTNEWLTKFIIA